MEIAAERRGILSRTILTCGPNQAMGELHDRMPVILSENDWPKWLGEEAAGVKEIGCRVLHNLLKNSRACLNAAPTAMAGYF
jgi:putative SOS response-associated peptidase YedK